MPRRTERASFKNELGERVSMSLRRCKPIDGVEMARFSMRRGNELIETELTYEESDAIYQLVADYWFHDANGAASHTK